MRALIGMAAIGAGAVLAWAAFPTAVAGLIEAAGKPALRQVHGEQALPEPALRRLVRSRQTAADWRATGPAYTDIALLRLMLGETGDASLRAGQLALAEAALAMGLGLAPMDPYGWMRLVQVRTMRGRPVTDITLPLRLALSSGPHEERRTAMLLLMLTAGLRVWEELDGRERHLIRSKAREAWRRDAHATAAAVARVGGTDRLARLLGL